MKKLLLLGLFLLIAATAFSQIELSAGAQAGYILSSYGMKIEIDADNWMQLVQTDNIIGFSAFFDATYVRLALEYGMSLGATVTTTGVLGGVEQDPTTDESPDGYSMNLLNIILIGKYPIALGPVIIWPTAGIRYSVMLSMDGDGDGEADDLSDFDYNDLYGVIGCGLDYSITKNIYLTLNALFNWNFMANPYKDYEEPTGYTETFTQWLLSVNIGAGFKF